MNNYRAVPELYYYNHAKIHGFANFGDDLNPWFFDELFQHRPLVSGGLQVSVIGIGTLINDFTAKNVPEDHYKLVISSGVGYGDGLPLLDEKWRFYAVRGAMSRKACDLPDAVPTGDGAMLLPEIVDESKLSDETRGQVVFMPHVTFDQEASLLWRRAAELADVVYVSPSDEKLKIISALARARLVITSAMHGAIVADAFRTPWIAVHTDGLLQAKWLDWGTSLDLHPRFSPLSRLWTPENIFAKMRANIKVEIIAKRLKRIAKLEGQLSSEKALAHVQCQLREAVDRLSNDLEAGSLKNAYLSGGS